MQIKERALSVFRAAGLLPALDAARLMRESMSTKEENSSFLRAHPKFSPPPLRWMHDMYRHTSYPLYWQTGFDTAVEITALIKRHITMTQPRVADWGCGLARVIRRLPETFERYGFDYNEHAIEWNKAHIQGVHFARNKLHPPLPAGDGEFDVVYALSVFTHLSAQAHKEWMAEIDRVLAPGGIFIGAFHMAPKPEQLLPLERRRFEAGELVVRGRVAEGSRTFVAFHPEKYLRAVLFAGFEILEGPAPFFGQTLFVVRKQS